MLLAPLLVAAWNTVISTADAITPITAFNLTAISAVNDASVLECWQITLPLTISQAPGTKGAAVQQLGNLSNMTWSSIPGGYPGSPHPAPAVQYGNLLCISRSWYFSVQSQNTLLTIVRVCEINRYNAILSGILRITIPNSPQQATVYGGKYGLIIAVDTADVSKIGHVSSTLGTEELTALMIPTESGRIPSHKIIHSGACEKCDLEL